MLRLAGRLRLWEKVSNVRLDPFLRYTYPDNSNRLGAVGQDGLSYDAAGHLTKDAHGRILTYNQAGRLTTVTHDDIELARYTYNANGQRIVKTTPAGTVVYHYGLAGRLIGETTEDGTPVRDYLWHGLTPIAQIDVGETAETPLYLHTDHLATPRLATDAAGQTVWRWHSDAFGAAPADQDVDGDGIATRVNLRFPGQYYDEATGLHYNWFRYYDPQYGRYLTSDPVGLVGGINPFAYVDANPIKYMDPFGLWSFALEGYYGIGGGVVFGKNPDGSTFVSFRVGFGLGGGIAFDPAGTSSEYGSCKDDSNLGFFDGIDDTFTGGTFGGLDAAFGPAFIGTSGNAGVSTTDSQQFDSYLNSPSLSYGVVIDGKWALSLGGAVGAETTYVSRSKLVIAK